MSRQTNVAGKLVLGMDTSGTAGSIALARVAGNQVLPLGEQVIAGRQYSAELLPALQHLLADAALSLAQMDAIVVVSGPGSFTGLRIGISAAKALAEALDLPVIAVSRLALLASLSVDEVIAVLDAGRGEYFVRMTVANAGDDATESLETLAALSGKLSGQPVCICEPGLEAPLAALSPRLLRAPTALDAIRYATARLLTDSFEDPATLDANYVRRPYQQPANPA